MTSTLHAPIRAKKKKTPFNNYLLSIKSKITKGWIFCLQREAPLIQLTQNTEKNEFYKTRAQQKLVSIK